jgi:transcriptional regulator with XRE-family HTH domain
MQVGSLIKTIRTTRGISQKALSELLEISANYLCQIETSGRMPSSNLLARIAEVLQISEDALVFLGTDVPKELDGEGAQKYRELQESVASLLIFRSKRVA